VLGPSVYSSKALKRQRALTLAVLALAACGRHHAAPRAPLFPLSPAWKTPVGDLVVPPLAADGRRVYVATRDGSVQALDLATGAVVWKAEGLAGRLTAGEGTLLVRRDDGAVWSLQPRSGTVRWKADTAVTGPLPAVLDGQRALVAGGGLAALDLASGQLTWKESAPSEVTTSPVVAGARLIVGEADGTLRCRDRASGVSLWTYRTARALAAPPLVDQARRRVYLGTTDKRILELTLDRGRPGWRWTVGADIQAAGLLLPGRVVFASFEAVLYALLPGGNLAWRAPLPSRPLSGPLLVQGYVVVACLENELVGFSPDTGKAAGSLRTGAEIRTPPLVAGRTIVIGLRDRSVVSYALPESPAAAPREAPSPATPPAALPVAPPGPGR